MTVETLQLDSPSDSQNSSEWRAGGTVSSPPSPTAPESRCPETFDAQRIEQQLRRKRRWRYTRWPSSEAVAVEFRPVRVEWSVDDVAQQRRRRSSPSAVLAAYARSWQVWLSSMLVHALALWLLGTWSMTASERHDRLILLGPEALRKPAPLTLPVQVALPREEAPLRQVNPLIVPSLTEPDQIEGVLAALPTVEKAWRDSGPVGEVRALFGRGGAGAASEGVGAAGAEFFGVKARGSKFVFVVDCSKSMLGDKWRRACEELEQAIGRLGKDKFFYVVLFDGDTHPMFEPDDFTPQLLPATEKNRERFHRWLPNVQLGYFTRPAQAMRLALDLKPDAIYLLSDGEFSDSTASYLRQKNKIDDGEQIKMPASVVHTIGFYSDKGQRTLRRIARGNGGEYKFVGEADISDLSRN